MLHIKQIPRWGEIVDEVQGDFDTLDEGHEEQMTIKGLRDFLNVLIDEGYGEYGACFGYDSNCVYTYPSKCIRIKGNQLWLLE